MTTDKVLLIRYWNPEIAPLTDAMLNGLAASPWPSAFSKPLQSFYMVPIANS